MQIVIAVGMWIFQIGVVVWITLPLLGVWPGPFGYSPMWDVFRLHVSCQHPECVARRTVKEIEKRGVVDWALNPDMKTVKAKVKGTKPNRWSVDA